MHFLFTRLLILVVRHVEAFPRSVQTLNDTNSHHKPSGLTGDAKSPEKISTGKEAKGGKKQTNSRASRRRARRARAVPGSELTLAEASAGGGCHGDGSRQFG